MTLTPVEAGPRSVHNQINIPIMIEHIILWLGIRVSLSWTPRNNVTVLAEPGQVPVFGKSSSSSSIPRFRQVSETVAALSVEIINVLIDHSGSSIDLGSDLKLELKLLYRTVALAGLTIQDYNNRPLGQCLAYTIIPEMEQCRLVLQKFELLSRVSVPQVSVTWQGSLGPWEWTSNYATFNDDFAGYCWH